MGKQTLWNFFLAYLGVIYGNNTFVVVGVNGTILTSSDGISWTSKTSGTNYHLEGVTYGNNTFVVVGEWGTILTSSNNGVSWIESTFGITNSLSGVTYDNNTFVAVGGGGTIIQSDPIISTDISVSPMMLDFNNVNVGSSSSNKTITVNNTGSDNIVIGTVNLTGTNADEFSIQNDNCSGQTIAPSVSRTIDVVFSPTSTGAKTAILSITSNVPTIDIALIGIGVDGNNPDTTPPTVISTEPGNNATDISIYTTITATFSEPMDGATINSSTFTVNGATGVVTYNGAVAIFTPSVKLTKNTTYSATIKTGVKDLAGNAMDQNYTWSFTTASASDTNNSSKDKSGEKKGCFVSVIVQNIKLDKYLNILTRFRDKYFSGNIYSN